MTMGIVWHSFFFYLMALAACLFAVAVVISGNIVRMAFYLVMCLGMVAGLFFLAGADFVGALQLMIYVGGTLVLLVFGVMLTARGPFVSMATSRGQWLAAGIAGAALLAVLVQAALSVHSWAARGAVGRRAVARPSPSAERLGLGVLGIRVDRLDSERTSRPEQHGLAGYLLPFEIVSVHLVVVLVGAAYLARARRRVRSNGTGPPQEPATG